MTLLQAIDDPAELRQLGRAEIEEPARELRQVLLESVARTGGHLSSNLVTVELTVAPHYVSDRPRDRIVRDVGHESPGHKMLAGRRIVFGRGEVRPEGRARRPSPTCAPSPLTLNPYCCWRAGTASWLPWKRGVPVGGAGTAVAEMLAAAGTVKSLPMLGERDAVIDHDETITLLAAAGLDAHGIVRSIPLRVPAASERQAANDT